MEAASQAACVGRRDAGMNGLEGYPSGSPDYCHHYPVAWSALDSLQPYLKVAEYGRREEERYKIVHFINSK